MPNAKVASFPIDRGELVYTQSSGPYELQIKIGLQFPRVS